MKEKSSKLQHQQEQEQVLHSSPKTEAREARVFQSSEEMLRFDAERTPVPAAVKTRLADSVAKEPRAKKSWWQRLFRG